MEQDDQSLNEKMNSYIETESDDNCSDFCSEMDDDDDYVYDDNDDDDYVYDDDQYSYHSEEDDEDHDDNGDHSYVDKNGEPQQSHQMLSTSELSTTLSHRISKISTLHNLTPSITHALLRHYRWNDERLTEALLTDPLPAFSAAGISAHRSSPPPPPPPTAATPCPICFTDDEPLYAMPCGHYFCLDCWGGFLRETLSQGHLSCFAKTCPEHKCNERITGDEIQRFVPELMGEYRTLQLRAFADEDDGCRWCPAPGCDRIAVMGGGRRMADEGGGTAMVIVCDGRDCGRAFCLRCGEEPHAPVKCVDLGLWMEKNRDESLTMDWVLMNTKKCGGCGKRIEKNQGCNHMTCKCGYEFCWVCGKEWKTHTGGYYNCNQFQEREGETAEKGEREKELDKYLHYYKRYLTHDQAQKFADKQLKEILDGTDLRIVEYMKENDGTSWHEVEFLKEANKQLVDCRRTLKFTYVFAYYMKDKGLITEAWADLEVGGDEIRQTSVGSVSSLGGKKGKNKGMKAKINGIGRGIARQWSNRSDRSSSSKSIGSSGIMREVSDSTAIEKEIGLRQKEQFEEHQKKLEMFTEELSELVEKPVADIVRIEVVNKTKIVAKYLSNILSYTEEQF